MYSRVHIAMHKHMEMNLEMYLQVASLAQRGDFPGKIRPILHSLEISTQKGTGKVVADLFLQNFKADFTCVCFAIFWAKKYENTLEENAPCPED